METSLFNDVLGPVMRGPSSSHCAAALRIGRLVRDLSGGHPGRVVLTMDTDGSLPATHASQGSDMGLFGGLMGWDADDARLPEGAAALGSAGIAVEFVEAALGDPHPNTYRLAFGPERDRRSLVAISTGGGMIEVIEIDGFPVRLHGDRRTMVVRCAPAAARAIADRVAAWEPTSVDRGDASLVCVPGIDDSECGAALADIDGLRDVRTLERVLPVATVPGAVVPFRTCAEMEAWVRGRDLPLWRCGLAYECARGGLSEDEVLERALDLVRILRRSIAAGLAGTEHSDRVLGCQSVGYGSAWESGRLYDAGVLNRIILYTTAMMEVKSSNGVIVAMPTAGACAALPGALLGVADSLGWSDRTAAEGLLAAGVVGMFIATAWSFAAEVGGCQAEGGSAAAMAAGALACLHGGTLAQSVGAASMALQSMLGLICDPVANRVEAPCLGKNVMAAANALSCANMALAGYAMVIPLDETIAAAREVAARMPREHRCTALGGLSTTPTSRAIELRLAAGGCGAGCGAATCRC
ncbi:MAG: L-serine ammonia-lyase, iron-sulfur-dependent, subunit alpha [Armatimonadota bacterium]